MGGGEHRQASAEFYRQSSFLSSVSEFSQLPFPETGRAGLERRLYIQQQQQQHSDAGSAPGVGTTQELPTGKVSSSSGTTSGDDPTGHHGNLGSGSTGMLHTRAAQNPNAKGCFFQFHFQTLPTPVICNMYRYSYTVNSYFLIH